MRRLFALAAALALLLSACGQHRGIYSNYRAVEELQLVLTLGIDADKAGLLLSAAAGRPRDGSAPTLLRRSAPSLPQGMAALQARTPRGQLYFAHTRYLLLGEAFAVQGVNGVIDFVERDIETRMGAALFVVRSGTAEALVTGSGEDWDVNDVLSTVKAETDKRGDSHVRDVRETAVALSEYGAALVCALRTTDTEGSVFGLPPGLAAVPDGFGILRGGALVGYLDGAEAQAASMMLGTLGTVSREIGDGSGGTVTVDLSCGAPTFTLYRAADGSPGCLEIRAAPTAVLAHEDVPADPAAIASALNDALREELTRTLARSRAENADFLALGRALRTHGIDPSLLPADWLETLETRVLVETTVRHSYDLSGQAGGIAA